MTVVLALQMIVTRRRGAPSDGRLGAAENFVYMYTISSSNIVEDSGAGYYQYDNFTRKLGLFRASGVDCYSENIPF